MAKQKHSILEVKPLAHHAAVAREAGFQMLYHDEAPTWMMWPLEPEEGVEQRLALIGKVQIRLEPQSIAAREALRRASDDPRCDGFESTTFYEVVDLEEGRINDPLDVAVHDTAVHALGVAADVLHRRGV